jgi:hypothetical protein
MRGEGLSACSAGRLAALLRDVMSGVVRAARAASVVLRCIR